MVGLRRLPALFLGAAVLATLWVTNAGPTSFMSGGAEPRQTVRPKRPKAVHHPPPGPVDTHHGHSTHLPWYEIVAYVFLGLFVLALLALLVSATVGRRRREHRPDDAPESADAFEAMLVPAVLVESAERLLRSIREGPPRNAIVACWSELERACGATGLPRQPAETSAEFTRRVLARYLVEASTIEALAGLYREARFSLHVMTEADRDRAVGALDLLLVDLRDASLSAPSPVPTP